MKACTQTFIVADGVVIATTAAAAVAVSTAATAAAAATPPVAAAAATAATAAADAIAIANKMLHIRELSRFHKTSENQATTKFQ